MPTGNQTFSLVLSNATAGATLIGPTNVPVTIVDDKVGISFAAPVYVVSETAGTVLLSVFRQNGTNQVTTVHYSTTNLTASAGTNYVGITNATLTFNPGETAKGLAGAGLARSARHRQPRLRGEPVQPVRPRPGLQLCLDGRECPRRRRRLQLLAPPTSW